MLQLSQHYLNDDAKGLDQDTRDYLDEHYLRHLKNFNRSNPKLLVVFSGGNAMGKSTISRKISEKLNGLVLENDAIKRQLLKRTPSIERAKLNQLTWQYSMDLYSRLDSLTHNGLIVRDGVIDWYYDRILPLFEKAGYPIFVIGFDVTREKAIALIKERGDTPTVKAERLYQLLGDHELHTKRFRKAYKPDVTLTDSTIFEHGLILAALQERLKG